MKPTLIAKRDGRQENFQADRIAAAVHKSLCAVGEDDAALASELGQVVAEHLERTVDRPLVALEEVQDAVVHVLQESGHYRAAIAYTRYRDERERQRRTDRLVDATAAAPNLLILDADGRYRRWNRAWLIEVIVEYYQLEARAADKLVPTVEELLVGTVVDELPVAVLLSLIDTALVRLGMHAVVAQRGALRLDRGVVDKILAETKTGSLAIGDVGRALLRQWSLNGQYPLQVLRQLASGRLWFDGLDDPRRGSQLTVVLEGPSNPWQVLTTALAQAQEGRRMWRNVIMVLPPNLLGHLERGAQQFRQPISALAELAQVHLACDGRTPLLADWPFPRARTRHPVSVAVAHDDFLIMHQVHELGLPLLAGPHLFEPGWRAAVAVELALNAQGLEGEFSTLDGLAMGLVAAATARLAQLGPAAAGGDVRFALSGLPTHSASAEYLERQIIQEGLRAGVTLKRSANLSEEACAHLGRLLE